MTDETPPTGTRTEVLLRDAAVLYRETSEALREAADVLKANADPEVRRIADLVKDHWKAMQTTLQLEIDLEKRDRERAGIVHGYALDLDAARREIGRRLACLKTAGGDPGLSGGADR